MTKVVDQMRTRKENGKNYFAIYNNREVIRFIPDETRDIEATTVPEFMDIKLTNACNGNCPYCYQNSVSDGCHAENPVQRLEDYFAGVPLDQMPFQVALGGGDPLLHPEFRGICEWFADRGVVPNLTTNGLNFTEDNLDVIKHTCGGVAITAHSHLDPQWKHGFDRLVQYCESPALHVLYQDAESIDYVESIIDEFQGRAYAIVMLPLVAQGRAVGMDDSIDYDRLNELVNGVSDFALSKLAWGAMAYDYIREQPRLKRALSLYEPEQFSRYLDLTNMKEYSSSFAVHDLEA